MTLANKELERRRINAREGHRASSFTNVGVRAHRHPVSFTCYCTKTPQRSDIGDAFLAKLDAEERRRRTIWTTRIAGLRYEHRNAQSRLHQLHTLRRSCAAGNVSVYWREPWGTQWAVPTWGLGNSVCESAESNIDATLTNLRRIEAQAYDEARRLRINPGEARLQ